MVMDTALVAGHAVGSPPHGLTRATPRERRHRTWLPSRHLMDESGLTLLDGVRCGAVPVPGGRGHALLACLALEAPRSVGVAQLVDRVWPGVEPEHPQKALQVLVSRTRSRTSSDTVLHEGSGYRLGLRDDQVDALRLRRLLRSAEAARKAGDLDVVRHATRDALAMPITSSAAAGPLADLVEAASRDRSRAQRLLGGVLLGRGDASAALALLQAACSSTPRMRTSWRTCCEPRPRCVGSLRRWRAMPLMPSRPSTGSGRSRARRCDGCTSSCWLATSRCATD